MAFDYLNHELTLQNIMDSDSELEYITSERNIILLMIERICNGLTGNEVNGAVYRNNILIRNTSVDCLERIGYNLFQQSVSKVTREHFVRTIAKKVDHDGSPDGNFTIVAGILCDFEVFPYHLTSVFRGTSEMTGFLSINNDNFPSPDSLVTETVVEMEFRKPCMSSFFHSEVISIRLQNMQLSGRSSPSTEVTTVSPSSEVTTVSPSREVTKVSLCREVTTVSPSSEVTTVSPSSEVTTVSPSSEVTTVSPSSEVTTVSPSSEVTTVSPSSEVTTVSPSSEVTTVSPSSEVTTDSQQNGASGTELQPVDLSMVWSQKYWESQSHLAFKLSHPFLYKQEYYRIRQSRLKVFDCLMNRQTHGSLNQRKVLEVIARPYYNIYPPADKEDIERFNEYLETEDGLVNLEGYALLKLELCRSFNSFSSPTCWRS